MAKPLHGDDWAVQNLRAAIDSSGLGVKLYAKRVLVRPPSTIYRWLSGSRPIPKRVREHLTGEWRILDAPPMANTTDKEEK